MTLKRLFTEHPHSVGETYLEHARHAASFARALFFAGAAAGIHALLPFLYERTASETIKELYQRMVIQRRNVSAWRRSGSTEFIGEHI
jgi:hypothetical protein